MVDTFNLNTWAAEADGSFEFQGQPVFIGVPGQPGLHTKTLSKTNKTHYNLTVPLTPTFKRQRQGDLY